MDHYDDAIIGSSPLLLLVARELAAGGRSVCVLERESELGGAWQRAALADGGEVEVACHLIEAFPGVYRYLEKVTGSPFVPLQAQPVRVHRSGLRVAYFSRKLLLLSGVRLLVGLLGEGLPNRIRHRPDAWINYSTKLKAFVRFQRGSFVRPPKVEGPEHGYSDLLAKLVRACEDVGVEFHTCNVGGADRVGGIWMLAGEHGPAVVSAARVHVTTAASLRAAGPGRLEPVVHRTEQRSAVVVDVENGQVQVRQSYVAFWQDDDVFRISRVDDPRPDPTRTRFLVELRAGHESDERLVRDKLVRAGIVRTDAPIRVAGTVRYCHPRPAEHLPEGEIDQGVHTYFSSGNLAAGIASWLHRG